MKLGDYPARIHQPNTDAASAVGVQREREREQLKREREREVQVDDFIAC